MNYPEFSQMFGGIRIFSSKSRAKSIDIAQTAGIILHTELA